MLDKPRAFFALNPRAKGRDNKVKFNVDSLSEFDVDSILYVYERAVGRLDVEKIYEESLKFLKAHSFDANVDYIAFTGDIVFVAMFIAAVVAYVENQDYYSQIKYLVYDQSVGKYISTLQNVA